MIKFPSERPGKLQSGSADYVHRPMQEGNVALSARPAKGKVLINQKTVGLKIKEIEAKARIVKEEGMAGE